MSGVKLNINFDSKHVARELNELVDSVQDRTALHRDIGEYMQLSTAERFAKEQAPDGTPWEPLKESTKKRKTKNRNSILRENDFLRDTLAYDASSDAMEFGSNRVQAALMQWGGTDDMAPGPAAVEARAFVGVSNDDEDEIMQLADDFLMPAVRH